MEISTAPLSEILKNAKDINVFLKENQLSITDPTLSEHLNQLLSLKGLKRQDVINNAQLDSNYVNQLFTGRKKNPGRNQILSLAFGFGLNNEETARLLKISGVGALYPKNKRDAVIIHSLENGKSITQANEILNSLEIETLTDYRK